MAIMCEKKRKTIKLHWIHTSDVHGSVFSYDYINKVQTRCGLASIYAYVQKQRLKYGDNLILSDGGDVLQGQPLSYYYNYVAPHKKHFIAQAMNELRYDVAVIGNHDIETGHKVYDRFVSETHFPYICANIRKANSNVTYFKPYQIINKEGVRIAVLGMLTPCIPCWLPTHLWACMEFDDIIEASKYWINYLKEIEKPDLIVGIFHSGWDGGIKTKDLIENETKLVAEQVDGYDLIFYGHDHRANRASIKNVSGRNILCLSPSSQGYTVVEADINIEIPEKGKPITSIKGRIKNIHEENDNNAQLFEISFLEEKKDFEAWLHRPIARLAENLYENKAYFGPSLFIDLIHSIQLEMTHADVSFAAPVSYNSKIPKGDISVSDMFSLYKYENFLYKVKMSGLEIRNFLEMSYSLWANTMLTESDHALLLDYVLNNNKKLGLKNLCYNMEAAAGIVYTIDLTKPFGEKISIESFANGKPFCLTEYYEVAMNSYRACGGGELITRGAGIPKNALTSRYIWCDTVDLRSRMIQQISKSKIVKPTIISKWKFIPEEWTKKALQEDYKILFKSDGEETE